MKGFKMSSDTKSCHAYSEPSGERIFSFEPIKSSGRHRHVGILKETELPVQAKQGLKRQEKLKAKYGVSQSYGDLPRELRKRANDGIIVQPKTSENHQLRSIKDKAMKDDELVKYMSNLPAYLQRMDRGENMQEKALNVGVLDWSRLEKWKGNQTCNSPSGSNHASSTSSSLSSKATMSSGTISNAVHNKTPSYRDKQHTSPPSLNSSHHDRISRAAKSIRNAARFQDFETASKSFVDGQKKVPRTNKSFGRGNSIVILEKEKREGEDQKINLKVGKPSSNLRYDGILTRPKVSTTACSSGAEKTVEEKQESDRRRKPLHQNITSSIGASPSLSRSYVASLNSREKKSAVDGKTKKGIEELQESAIDFSSQNQPVEKKSIVLLLPKRFSRNSSLQEPGTLLDKDLPETNRNSFADSFSHKDFHSSELSSEIPHSCPQLSSVEGNADIHKTLNTTAVAQSAEMPSDTSHAPACSRKMPITLSKNRSAEENTVQTANGTGVENSNFLDRETLEMLDRKGRHPSLNRRFSFSLSRMTRSFSFKESSPVPQLSSAYASMKSGPVMSKSYACLDNSNREKASGHTRARSSPLRRILDPLLKSKSSKALHYAETDSLKSSLSSFSLKRIDVNEPLKDKKHETSRIKALMQLTVKNGIPLFRFVVDNNSVILAATIDKSTSPWENDCGCNYTFYAIDEIKKKGNWINQVKKEKGSGFVYNVIGQMKVDSSSSLDLASQNSIFRMAVTESVLFGADASQADQAAPKVMPKNELAAVVVKMTDESLRVDAKTDKKENSVDKGSPPHLQENGCSCGFGETENCSSATVILPGGNHSMPNNVVPSPLIHRWKSGGSCDCGGWDIGCKLHILSGERKHCKFPRISKGCLMSDRFELFTQGTIQQDEPTFSLERMEKGMHSVEFSSSVSPLQAFFICVTIIRCQKSADLLDIHSSGDEKVYQDPRNSGDGMKKSRTTFPGGEATIRYTLSPPVSPVERV